MSLVSSLPISLNRLNLLHPAATAAISGLRGFTRQMATDAGLKKTVLHDLHVEEGGKMVPFAGWRMPVQYRAGVLGEHMQVREKAGLFDVSHMLQVTLHGKDREKFLEQLVVANVTTLKPETTKYSLITNERGGLVDDTVITKKNGYIYMVVNAACADKDMIHFRRELERFRKEGGDVDIRMKSDTHSLIALQGPLAASVLQRFVKYDLSKQKFMTSRDSAIMGVDNCYVGRCGYTGEDGFELSIPHEAVDEIARRLLRQSEVGPAGLGARDSLRLEAGLSLYGHDLNEDTTPIEANLAWTIPKKRKQAGGYLGADTVIRQLKYGPECIRQGILVDGAVREGAAIYDLAGVKIGVCGSGGFSPILKKGVAMGYIPTKVKVGDQVKVEYRGKRLSAVVVNTPFVPTNYYVAKKK